MEEPGEQVELAEEEGGDKNSRVYGFERRCISVAFGMGKVIVMYK